MLSTYHSILVLISIQARWNPSLTVLLFSLQLPPPPCCCHRHTKVTSPAFAWNDYASKRNIYLKWNEKKNSNGYEGQNQNGQSIYWIPIRYIVHVVFWSCFCVLLSWSFDIYECRNYLQVTFRCTLLMTYCEKYELSSNSSIHQVSSSLIHWGRDMMATSFQTTFSNAFSWMKIYKLWLRFHCNFFPRVQITIFHHCFRQWLGAGQATSHYLCQCWLVDWRIYASLSLNEVKCFSTPGNTQLIITRTYPDYNETYLY